MLVRQEVGSAYHRLLWRTIGAFGTSKEKSTMEELGYSPKEFREYFERVFESGMSWENHGNGPGKWNIDHVRPINTFSSDTPPSVVNDFLNLRPLWWTENLSRPKDGSDMIPGGW